MSECSREICLCLFNRSPCPGHHCSHTGLPLAQLPPQFRLLGGPTGSLGFCCCLCPQLGQSWCCQWDVLVQGPWLCHPRSVVIAPPHPRPPAAFDWATCRGGGDRSRVGEEGLYCKYAEQLSVNTCLCLPVADNEVQGLGSPVTCLRYPARLAGVLLTPPHSGGPD